MNPTATPTTNDNNNNVRVRKCGVCHGIGHDRRNCPSLLTTVVRAPSVTDTSHTTGVEIPPVPPLVNLQQLGNPIEIDMERVLYFVFDLETTGFVNKRDEIIEIAGLFF